MKIRQLYLVIIFLFIGLSAFSQEAFYYYKGEKIPLVISETRFSFRATKDFDKSILEKEGYEVVLSSDKEASKDATLIGEIQVKDLRNLEKLKDLKQYKNILKVFPAIQVSENKSIGTSDIFYVKLKNSGDEVLLDRLLKDKGAKIVGEVPHMPLWFIGQLGEASSLTSYEITNYLYETNSFDEVDPAFLFDFASNCANDPMLSQLWGLLNTVSEGIDINICPAWTLTEGAGVNVAVVDQGIHRTHNDLSQNLSPLSFNTLTGAGPSVFNGTSHGTHVAGTIAAVKDNNLQVVGVAPKAKIMGVSNPLSLNPQISAQLASGISWAWQNGASVINNSWGDQGGQFYQQLHSIILEQSIVNAMVFGRGGRGAVVVFAAGNNGTNILDYPANFHPDILTVGAIDRNGFRASFSAYGDQLDVVAPGVGILSTVAYNGTASYNGTSMAAPHVAGVAALIFSVNSYLTGKEVRDIIKSTARKINSGSPYFYSSVIFNPSGFFSFNPNGSRNSNVGYGLVDAYAAVLKAKAAVDLRIRNSIFDTGIEPDFQSGNILHDSPDVWVRNLDDGGLQGQNPIYGGNAFNYIYVRVKNHGYKATSADNVVRMHWAQAHTVAPWPTAWDGTYWQLGIPMGGLVGTQPLPVLQPGQETIVKFPWRVPNPAAYTFFKMEDRSHFCLLARVISPEDPMTVVEGPDVVQNVRNNNNIGWKNFSIITLGGKNLSGGATVLVGNPFDLARTYRLDVKQESSENSERDQAIFKEAEINVVLDPVLFKAWQKGGMQGKGVKYTGRENEIRIVDTEAYLDKVVLEPHEWGAISLRFNFLTQKYKEGESYTFHLTQADAEDDTLMGGEAFRVVKEFRELFKADAGGDQTVSFGENVLVQAKDIGETATYNWYDDQGNLIHVGRDFERIVEGTTELKLEVITTDGFKDYDKLVLDVRNNSLGAITPNPASTSVELQYNVHSSKAAYIKIIPIYGASGNGRSYDLDNYNDRIRVDVTSYVPGVYSVILYIDGKQIETKKLIIQ